eukprot:COSAG02_NODE_15508_length_1164_cov_1.641315_1_plen_350_part_00
MRGGGSRRPRARGRVDLVDLDACRLTFDDIMDEAEVGQLDEAEVGQPGWLSPGKGTVEDVDDVDSPGSQDDADADFVVPDHVYDDDLVELESVPWATLLEEVDACEKLSHAQKTKSLQDTLPDGEKLIARALHWRRLRSTSPREYEATQAARAFITKAAVLNGLRDLLNGELPDIPSGAMRSLTALREVYVATYMSYTAATQEHGMTQGTLTQEQRALRHSMTQDTLTQELQHQHTASAHSISTAHSTQHTAHSTQHAARSKQGAGSVQLRAAPPPLLPLLPLSPLWTAAQGRCPSFVAELQRPAPGWRGCLSQRSNRISSTTFENHVMLDSHESTIESPPQKMVESVR